MCCEAAWRVKEKITVSTVRMMIFFKASNLLRSGSSTYIQEQRKTHTLERDMQY